MQSCYLVYCFKRIILIDVAEGNGFELAVLSGCQRRRDCWMIPPRRGSIGPNSGEAVKPSLSRAELGYHEHEQIRSHTFILGASQTATQTKSGPPVVGSPSTSGSLQGPSCSHPADRHMGPPGIWSGPRDGPSCSRRSNGSSRLRLQNRSALARSRPRSRRGCSAPTRSSAV